MWTYEHSFDSDLPAEILYNAWTDMGNIHLWNTNIEWASLDGVFAKGAEGKLKPKDSPQVGKIKVTYAEPNKHFTIEMPLPLAKLIFDHTLSPTTRGTKISERIIIQGPLTFLWVRLMVKGLTSDADTVLPALSRYAQMKYKDPI